MPAPGPGGPGLPAGTGAGREQVRQSVLCGGCLVGEFRRQHDADPPTQLVGVQPPLGIVLAQQADDALAVRVTDREAGCWRGLEARAQCLGEPMLRTTRPKAMPRSCSTVLPGSSNAVVTGNAGGEGAAG
jgi:hypothetical protein